jgi:serine/threonine-protein kinase PRP4
LLTFIYYFITELKQLTQISCSVSMMTSVIGKGVFSTVLKCSTISNSSSVELPPVVAMKFIRHNETMAKAALQELRFLQVLKGSAGIVPLLLPTTSAPIEHRGHVVLVFSFMEYNLRDVLQKFGKGVGLSLQAVRSYFGQLLAAATHLKKRGILHCDLKPDNILVSSDFGVCQLADFGSAIEANSGENVATPYLVSRFYRAPEIILGLTPTFAIDLWSIAVTVVELFLGDVLFKGHSNNDMLFDFMQHMGAFSNRMIRQHLAQCQKISISSHFQQDGPVYNFTQQTVDPVSGANLIKNRPMTSRESEKEKFPLKTPLGPKILKARSAKDSRVMVQQFSDLLQKCLTLDPSRRIELREALRHPFFASPMTQVHAAK